MPKTIFESGLFLFIAILFSLPVSVKSQHPGYGITDELTSNLPIVVINTYGQEIPDEPKITAHMGIVDNGPGMMNNQNDPFNDYDGYVGIEVRGQSSQYFYPKKSYSFETRDYQGENLDVSILGMPEENDWVLYAPYGDKSMLRNVVSYWISRNMGEYCTRTVFCEVILNGDYQGVYVMMEKIKKDQNRVNIATLKPDEILGDDLTGGYIVRVDKIDSDFQMNVDGWLSVPDPPYPNAMHIIFQYYYPASDELVSAQKAYIRNYISDTENTLTGDDFNDPDLGYNSYLNTGSFVDQMLLNELSKEVDKYRYSTYFFKEKDSDGGKLFAGPAWDFNLGYANVDYWQPGVEISGWVYPMVEPVDWGIMFWWKRLMEDSYFKGLSKMRWLDLRQNQLSDESIEYFIDSITVFIDEAQERNYERWPILGEYVWPNYNWQNNTYEDEVDNFRNWLLSRLNWMDYSLPGISLNPSAELTTIQSNTQLEIKLFDDYFSRKILKKKYFSINNAPSGLEIDTVIYQDASTAEVYLSNEAKGSVEITITMAAKILNTWDDLTTDTATIGISSPDNNADEFRIFSSGKGIYLECSRPELLGREIEIFNLSGQKVISFKLQQQNFNSVEMEIPEGIYLCRFKFDGKNQTAKLLLTQ
ncbi:MAG: CotH kinase family protein [Bacteroidales bacterium]|nr:CotH kinase family protein [Bacteroidales bacterium]